MILVRRPVMTDDRIDFSSLDPKREPERFEQMVQHVLRGATAATAAPQQLLEFLRFGRLGLAAAALVALGVWLPRLSASPMHISESGSNASESVVALFSSWARSGEVPANVDVIQTLGELDGR
jgi:hypothetical protein